MRRRHARQRSHSPRRWKLIVTDDPTQTLGEGRIRHYPTLVAAANAFANTTEPYRTIIYDDGHNARELNAQEDALLEHVCTMLGIERQDID